MKSLKNKFFIGLTAVAMTAAGGVFAQNSGMGMGAGTGAGMGMGMGGPGMHDCEAKGSARSPEKMKAAMEKHQAQLHAKLKLSAAQEPAWKTFVAANTPAAMPTPPDRKEMEKLTTPERMEKMMERSKEHQAKMQERLAALKTFYAALTPEQQKVFDDSHAHMGNHPMQRRGQEAAKTAK
jgi:protein CpxP